MTFEGHFSYVSLTVDNTLLHVIPIKLHCLYRNWLSAIAGFLVCFGYGWSRQSWYPSAL